MTLAPPPSAKRSDPRDAVVRLASAAAPESRLQIATPPIVGSSARTDAISVLVAGTLDGRLAGGAEAVMHAYLAEGTGFLDLLEGAFALALWDSRDEVLLLVRDALGIVPFFWARAGADVVAGTSLDAIISQEGVSGDLNIPALADHVCHRWPDPGETFYEAVRRVPPGHCLRSSGATVEVSRYWHPAPPGSSVDWLTEEDADRFDEVLDLAIGRALAPGRGGIYLSGGLDSVSVAAMAADRARRGLDEPPLALSIVFPTGQANEEDVQRAVARSLGLEHVLLPFDEAVGGDDLLGTALAASAAAEAPVMNIWYPAYRSLARVGADAGCRVALTGGGGDEWLGVSPLLAADLMRRGDVAGLYGLWRMLMRSFRLSPTATLRSVLWTFGGKPIVADLGERFTPQLLARHRLRTKTRMTPAWVAPDPAIREELLVRAAASVTPRAGHSFYLREGHLSLDHALVSMEMEEVFDNGRETGLPVRMPYWDARVVDFLYRTPPRLLNEGGRSKGLVRRVLARRFPEVGFERQRKVLATDFFASTMAQQAEAAWQRLGGPASLERLGIIDGRALHSEMNQIFGTYDHREVGRFWNLLTLEAWVRNHS